MRVTQRPATPEQLAYRAERFQLCTSCRKQPMAPEDYLCVDCRNSPGNHHRDCELIVRKLSGQPWRQLVGGVDYDTRAERDMDKEP